jgi:hypothetical protein
MNPDRDDEMPAEFDMRGGVRGKYVERYRRWASKHSITVATGTVEVCAVTSVREGYAKIVQPETVAYVTAHVFQERRDVIASAHVLQEKRDVIAPVGNAV